MKKIMLYSIISFFLGLQSCTDTNIKLLSNEAFETTTDGKPVELYTLKNGDIVLQVTNFGGRVVALWTPDKNGKYNDIVLGYDSIEKYIHNKGERFLGPIVGRYANRIAKGQFTLDSVVYQVPINNNGQSLHGGLKGLDMVVWQVDTVTNSAIKLSYTSPDKEEGYPGTVKITMVYELTKDNAFKITYSATTDKPTVINLSHHGLFNLKGESNGTILDNVLTLNASAITPIDSVLIPTGEILSVDNTPFDFRQPTAIGQHINESNEQLKNGSGYDHNWVIDRKTNSEVEQAAVLYEPNSGRVMEVWTDQPGIQFYSGNFFDGKAMGKHGPQRYREALALETQKFPDSPNHSNFPSTRLNPGETYTQTCIYKFSVK